MTRKPGDRLLQTYVHLAFGGKIAMKSCLAAVSVITVFLFSPLLALAQSLTGGEQIIVTASALPASLESTPASVSVITREEIENQRAADVADVLREVPGLAIARTGSPGKSTTLFIRGGSSKQALVLWNGVHMNDAYLSGYNLGQLSTAGVEKIEVIRGPYSALYGSEAVSGVVNILTGPAHSGLSVDLEGGGRGLRNAALAASWVNGMWSSYGSAEHRDDGGFARNDDLASETVVAGLQAAPAAGFSLALLSRYNRYDLGIPRNANASFTAFIPSPHRRQRGSEWQMSLPLHADAGPVRVDVRLSGNARAERFGDPDAPFGPEFSSTDSSTRSARLSVQSGHTAAGVVTLGGEVERNEVDHADSFGLDLRHRSRGSQALFLEDSFSRQFTKAALQLSVGVRYDRYDSFGSQVSPRLAAAWVSGNSKWRTAFGSGFRAPALGELYAPFFGNPALHAERSRNIEFGFDRYIGRSMLTVTAFRSGYDNLISYDLLAGRFGNIDRARSQGLEVGAVHRLGPVAGSVTYTRLRAIDRSTGEALARRPRDSGSATIRYDARPLSADVVVIYAGRRTDVTDLAPFGAVVNEAYTTADVALHYVAGPFTPYVRVENATGRKYEEVFGYPSPGRRVAAGVHYSLR